MKFSYYNFYIPYSEKGIYIIYNSLFNSMVQLDWEEGALVSKLNDLEIHRLSKDTIDLLGKNQMIIANDKDEFKVLNNRVEKIKNNYENSKTLFILFVPTNMCNMSCPYCYQGDKSLKIVGDKSLTSSNIEAIKEFVTKKLTEKDNEIKNIHMQWFGGEPLLYQNIISELSEYIMSEAAVHKVDYTASIITNAYLLKEQTWKMLDKYKIHHLQITIDGDRDMHNQMRFLGKNKGSFDTILNNIKQMPTEKFTVTIRINGDKEVFKTMPNLFTQFEEAQLWPHRSNQIGFDWANKYYAPSGDTQEKEIYFSSYEYHQSKVDFAKLQTDRYNVWASNHNKKIKRIKYAYPTFASFCCTTVESKNSFCLDSSAHIHKCYNTVNEKESRLEHVSQYSQSKIQDSVYKKFKKNELSECANCKILPICKENCNKRMMDGEGKMCSPWKYFMNERMINIYDQKFG